MRKWLPLGLPVIFVGIFFWLPLSQILQLGVSSGTANIRWDVVWFTTWQALVTSLLCVLIGLPLTYSLSILDWRGRNFANALAGLPFVLPTVIVAIALRPLQDFLAMGDSRSTLVGWIVFAHVFFNLSVVIRLVGNRWRLIPAEFRETAQLSGCGEAQIWRYVYWPEIRGAVAGSATLTFLFAWTSFGLVLLLGQGKVQSVEVNIWQSAVTYLDFASASRLALLQTVVTGIVFWSSRKISRDFGVSSESATLRPIRYLWQRIFVTATLLTLSATILLPLSGLLIAVIDRADSLQVVQLSGYGSDGTLTVSIPRSILNSLVNASLVSVISVCLAIVLAWYSAKVLSQRLARVLTLLASLPLGVSAVVLGLGYLITFDSTWGNFRQSSLIVVVAQSLIAMPFAFQFIYSALNALDDELRQAAQTMGASTQQIWWHIYQPLLRPALAIAASFSFLISLGDFGAASFIATGEKATITTTLYRLISRPGGQNYDLALLLSLIFIVVVFAVLYLANRVGSQKQQG